MPGVSSITVASLAPEQAVELSILIDLEACWDNLGTISSRPHDGAITLQSLHQRQKAYDTFIAKLMNYNKRYVPVHVPEQRLNTPSRLGIWCLAMRKLYMRLEHDSQGRCPVHLMEKAYRWADLVAAKTGMGRINRSNPPCTIGDAIGALQALGQWCDGAAQVGAGQVPLEARENPAA